MCFAVALSRDAAYRFQNNWVLFSRNVFAMYLKIQEISDILLSSSYDGVLTSPLEHPLDFSRASI